MLAAIQLDDQLFPRCTKIHYVTANGMLVPKVYITHMVST
jgi:hypothetical protein